MTLKMVPDKAYYKRCSLGFRNEMRHTFPILWFCFRHPWWVHHQVPWCSPSGQGSHLLFLPLLHTTKTKVLLYNIVKIKICERSSLHLAPRTLPRKHSVMLTLLHIFIHKYPSLLCGWVNWSIMEWTNTDLKQQQDYLNPDSLNWDFDALTTTLQ